MPEEVTESLPTPMAPSPRARKTRRRAELRVWLLPFAILASASLALLWAGYLGDAWRQPKAPGFIHIFTHFDPANAASVLGNVGQVVTQILGVAISVVAIIVELASNRYTHRITELFFRAPVNFGVMGLFVIAGLDGLWVSLMFNANFVPLVGTLLSMALMSVCLLILLPYFAYVFEFLNPMNIVARIRDETLEAVLSAPRTLSLAKARPEQVQHMAADGAEQLSDVVLNAMVNHDGAIAMASVNALGELSRDYMDVKGALSLDWFMINPVVSQNPDFVSMSPEVLEDLKAQRTWYEFKLLRQFQSVYLAALGGNRELCYLVAIHTRQLAERAMDHHDEHVLKLCVKFFNTYLRATVNTRDVRTAYNVCNQYRKFGESALRQGFGGYSIEIARYFKYYGQLAFHMDLGFVLETAAYDLCTLNELAFDLKSPERSELLRIFLQVDKEGEGATREASLRGVRKAQVKLATYYLLHQDIRAAREVFTDMRDEKPARLASIRDELLAILSPHFWEITDRGSNFDYIPPDRKRRLVEFFEWFGDAIPSARPSLIPSMPTSDGPGSTVAPPRSEAPPARESGDVPRTSIERASALVSSPEVRASVMSELEAPTSDGSKAS